jgi:hypothetical protein
MPRPYIIWNQSLQEKKHKSLKSSAPSSFYIPRRCAMSKPRCSLWASCVARLVSKKAWKEPRRLWKQWFGSRQCRPEDVGAHDLQKSSSRRNYHRGEPQLIRKPKTSRIMDGDANATLEISKWDEHLYFMFERQVDKQRSFEKTILIWCDGQWSWMDY